jgi:PAS domain S-box-containing protein
MKSLTKAIWIMMAALAVTSLAILLNLPVMLGAKGNIILIFLVFVMSGYLLFRKRTQGTAGNPSFNEEQNYLEMEALVDSLPDIVYRLDEQGNIIFINNAVMAYGYDPGQLRGKSIMELIHPDDRPVAERWLRERRTGKRRTKLAEIRFLAAGQEKVSVKEWICLVDAWGIYIPDGKGNTKYRGSRGVARDITSLKKIERDLKQSQRMLRAVLDTVPQRIFWKDRKGRFLGANNNFAADLGFDSPRLLTGCMDIDILPDKEQAKFFSKIDQQVINSGEPVNNIIEPLLTADGVHRWLETSKVPLYDPEGRIIGLLGTYNDITERIEQEKEKEQRRMQMIQADRMISLGVLVAGVAHEVNNPNNFIMMNTPILQRVWHGCKPLLERYYEENGEFMLANVPYSQMREQVPELFKGISVGSRRIEAIVSSLLDYSRQNNSTPLQDVDINDVLNESISMVSNLLKKSTNDFKLECASVLPVVNGDRQRIQQVLINLLQNACQALSDNSQAISATTCYDNLRGLVVISVRDEGAGIESGDSEHILKPFFTTKRNNGGTGLGLAICDGIMKDHSGWLEFDSEVGKGTTVNAYFPAFSGRTAGSVSSAGNNIDSRAVDGDD